MDASAELTDRIKAILVERLFLDVDPAELRDHDSLTDTYGVDSVRLFDLVVGLESDFDITFEDSELVVRDFDTVAHIVQRVHDKIGDA